MTRKGKIARLPDSIREQLNQRLQDGHDAKSLIAWLSPIPDVQSVLQAHFKGRPINAVNLTEWRQGGFREWQRQLLALQLVKKLDDEHFTGAMTARLACFFAVSAQAMVSREEDSRTRWLRLRELGVQLTRLRRSDLSSERISLERERLALKKVPSDDDRKKASWKSAERPDIPQPSTLNPQLNHDSQAQPVQPRKA